MDGQVRFCVQLCRRMMLGVGLLSVLALLLAPIGKGQSTGGRIRGTVTDPSGGAVAGVTITLVNTETNVSREATTGATGEYLFLEVAVGKYEITLNHAGFKKFVRKDIVVDLNAVVGVDIALQVGTTTETVEVTGQPPVVDTTTTQLGAIVNDRSATQLPLNQRDAYQLLQLQPGVQSQLGNDEFYGSDRPGVVTVNGGRGRSNNYSVNGGEANDLFVNLPAVEPSPDSIEEFRVITNSFDAEYGRNSGAVVNVVTKSGTNNLHGSVYEFFRNTALNAHPFTFAPAPMPAFNQNQFGGTLGGPIKKDRTFFFVAYEGRRIVQGIVSQPVVVPTASDVAGQFATPSQPVFTGTLTDATVASMLSSRCGSALSAASQANLNQVIAGTPQPYDSIFPNATIPTSCLDPVAMGLLKYVPGAGGNNSTVITVPKKHDFGNQFQVRLDHNLSTNQKLSFYYYFDDDDTLDPFAKFQAAGATLGNFPGDFATRTQQLNATHTWTIGSSAVNEFRFAYLREGQLRFNTPTVNNAVTASCGSGGASAYCFSGQTDVPLVDASGNCINGGAPPSGAPSTCPVNGDFGIHPGLGATKEGVPFIQVFGGFTIGNNYEGQLPQIGNTFQFSDNYSKIIGTHSVKFGGDVRYQRFDQTLYFNVNGWFTFTAGAGNNDLGISDPYADYLLGLPNTYSQGSAQKELIRSTSVYLFAQDSWKIKPNLTLNYGLRWEMNTPLTDIGQKVQTFRPGENTTIYPCQLSPASIAYFQGYGVSNPDCTNTGVLPTGLVFPGDKGVPGGLTNIYYKAFAPRLGLNWSPSWNKGVLGALSGGPGKSSVSAGFGMFYNPIEQLVMEQFSAEPPFGGSNSITDPLFQAPFVDQAGNVYPNPFNGILNPPRGTSIDWSAYRPGLYYGQFPANLRPQYADQYNLTIKRELPKDILVQVGYVGSQGHRLLASYNLNPGSPTTCLQLNNILGAGTCGPFGEDSAYFIPAGTVLPAGGLYLPYSPNGARMLPAGYTVGTSGITLVGLRRYSSPNCDPLSGTGCPVDGTPVFSGIYTENTIAKSNYNSLQVLVEKRFSHGLQFQAAYTFSKSLDNASSFENNLNPYNFNATYGPSLFDTRHIFSFNYVWDLPIPKFQGWREKVLDGWRVSGIIRLQTGFPIRITSQADNELYDATYLFEFAGEPNLVAPFKTTNPRNTVCAFGTGPLSNTGVPCSPVSGYAFDPNLFDNTNNTSASPGPNPVQLGTIGNAPRSICCGPLLNNWDMSFLKETQLTERVQMEFRGDVFNIWNHAQFYTIDGNASDQGTTFGQIQHVHDPRLVQFALKFRF
jgi:hypothetical protein